MGERIVLIVLLLLCVSSISLCLSLLQKYEPRARRIKLSATSYGPNNFGDIMSDRGVSIYFNADYSPIERIILSANGNLQRILSAYHGGPITIEVLKCIQLGDNSFHREVTLMLGERRLCTARGEIQVSCDRCLEAIASKRVGVGQLFRYLGVLPSFQLLAIGKTSDYDRNNTTTTTSSSSLLQRRDVRLWREYELFCDQLSCRFVEEFEHDFLEIY